MKKSSAFTLIELLVVIAIISILTALLFPVFNTVKESNRQSSTISHLQAIQSGLALFKLDNGYYPPVLFGYAPATGSAPSMANASAVNTNTRYVVGTTPGNPPKLTTEQVSLYPTYVNDYHDFETGDNPVDNNLTETVSLNSTEFTAVPPTCDTTSDPSCIQFGAVLHNFYVMDGMDTSPRISTANNSFAAGSSPSQFQYVLRYDRDWTNIQTITNETVNVSSGDPAIYYNYYLNQLRWKNPPKNSYVTSVTYHYPAGSVIIVLFNNGSALKIKPSQLAKTSGSTIYNTYDDSTSCYNTVGGSSAPTCALDANGDNPARFWRVSDVQ